MTRRVVVVVYLAGGPLFDGRRHSREGVAAESRARSGALGQFVTALAHGVLDAALHDLLGQLDNAAAGAR